MFKRMMKVLVTVAIVVMTMGSMTIHAHAAELTVEEILGISMIEGLDKVLNMDETDRVDLHVQPYRADTYEVWVIFDGVPMTLGYGFGVVPSEATATLSQPVLCGITMEMIKQSY